MEHSLHVASVAQTIARALKLNEDLVRAIAVGHDLGHPPFGHIGEEAINAIIQEANGDYGRRFSHELHSLRVVDFVERSYPDHHGLNLTFAVRDGIVCHHGEKKGKRFERELVPNEDKTLADLPNAQRGDLPATLEGCVVRWADKVAYLGRDLEDAQTLNQLKKPVPDLVKHTLGETNREIIATLVTELCRESDIDNRRIAIGEKIHDALNALYDFNFEYIYKRPKARKFENEIKWSTRRLFELLLERLKAVNGDLDRVAPEQDVEEKGQSVWRVLQEFLRHDIKEWQSVPSHLLVIDFIAGMTDSFFIQSCSQLFLPKSTV